MKVPNAMVPKRSITRLAPTSVWERRMRSGRSGARWRDSISAKAPRSTAEPANRRIVRSEPQPPSGASTTAYTSKKSAPVIVSAPAGS